jgi:hypothetical protein
MALHGDALVSFLPAGQLLTCMMRVNTAWRRLLMTRPDAWGQRLVGLKAGLPRQLPAYPWQRVTRIKLFIRGRNEGPFAVNVYAAFGAHRKLVVLHTWITLIGFIYHIKLQE